MKVTISCLDADWEKAVDEALARRLAVNLSHLDYGKDKARCDALAKRHSSALIVFVSDHHCCFNPPIQNGGFADNRDKIAKPLSDPIA
jgi:hypothetical protein